MATRTIETGGYKHTIRDLHARDAVRWAVGTKDGRRSGTWRMWGERKGDIYLSMRTMGAIVKVSLHRDRRCSVGFTQEYEPKAKEQFGISNRHFHRWVLPDAPVVKGFQILVPDSELVKHEVKDKEPMAWIPAPGEGRAVVFTIFVAEPLSAFSWENPEKSGNLVGWIFCPTRATWLVYKQQELDLETKTIIEENRTKGLKMAAAQSKDVQSEGMRLALYGHKSETDVFIIDLNSARLGDG